jgi:type IV pilus assembly protein PilO
MSYFDKLARLDRLVAIQSVQFAPVADFSPTEKRLNANVSLVVYRALTDAEMEARKKQQEKKK